MNVTAIIVNAVAICFAFTGLDKGFITLHRQNCSP